MDCDGFIMLLPAEPDRGTIAHAKDGKDEQVSQPVELGQVGERRSKKVEGRCVKVCVNKDFDCIHKA